MNESLRNELHEAFAILRLKPGSSKEAVQTRYKRLAMTWHPDRAHDEAGRKYNEEELKIINNARDLLIKHFDSRAHKATDCECQPSTGNQNTGQGAAPGQTGPGPTPGPTPGPGPSRNPADAEERARQRDQERERKRRAAAEEAARQQQQAKQQQAPQQSFQQAQTQEAAAKEHKLKWNIAKAEGAVLVGLCLFGWVGSGISASIHSWQAEQERQSQQKAADEVKKNDPCQSGTSQTPPSFAQASIRDSALQASRLWTTNCKGPGQGAIVTGEDERGRLITALYFGTSLVYQTQWLVSYDSTGNRTTVELWNAPNVLAGSTIYTYDVSHNLTEIRKLDAQSQPLIVGTIERRPGGGFFAVDTQFIGENRTAKFYQSDDPQLTKNFYLCEVFGRIPKQIDPTPTATAPDATPAYVPTGDLAERFKRQNPFAPVSPTPQIPFSTSTSTSTDQQPSPFLRDTNNSLPQTNTSTGEHIFSSPFSRIDSGPSQTPGTDALLRKIGEQNKKQ